MRPFSPALFTRWIGTQSWRIRLGPAGVQALREFPRTSLEFGRDAFAADPRIATIAWER